MLVLDIPCMVQYFVSVVAKTNKSSSDFVGTKLHFAGFGIKDEGYKALFCVSQQR